METGQVSWLVDIVGGGQSACGKPGEGSLLVRLGEPFINNLLVVECIEHVASQLATVKSLAGDKYGVPLAGLAECPADRLEPIGNEMGTGRTIVTVQDIVNDREG